MTAPAREIAAVVRSVTLLEDRAVVTRSASLEVEAGLHRLVVRGVAPTLADKTLAARVASGGARLHDVRVRRALRPAGEGAPEEARAVAAEIASLEDAIATREAMQRALAAETAQLVAAADLAVHEAAEDAAWSRLDVADALATQRRTDAQAAENADASVDADADRRHLRQRLADKRARAIALGHEGHDIEAWIEIDVEATGPAAIVLTCSYVVPGACWRPQHTATDLGGDRVRFACEAAVWQRTGETWTDVEVVLSTERASLGANPPDLASDLLTVTRKSPTLVVSTREQKVETAGLGRGAPPDAGLPGIDDGGEARRLVASGRHDIAGDGRPHRLPLFSFESGAKRDLVTMPELAAAVFERTELVNGAAQPLLAGPVDLVRRGGPCGVARLAYVAPGEAFHLGWGPDASLRVRRDVEPLPDESTFFSGWTTTTEDVVVRLSNLGGEPRRVVVQERVPVSEIEKVVVQVVSAKTTSGKSPDADGFLTWTLDVAPRGREVVRLRTSIKRHADVVG